MAETLERRREGVWIRVTDAPLEVSAADAALRDTRAGAVCVFLGTTRAVTGDRETAELRYEAYGEMALDELERLAGEAAARWPVLHTVLHHRTGVVAPAEASVLVGVSTPHRAEAFEAGRFLIDELKIRVPIWKNEVYEDGETEWVQPGIPDTDGEG